MDIDTFIQQAEELKGLPYSSPRIDLWETKVRTFVNSNYGPEYKKILDRALFFGQMIMSEAHGQHMHIDAMTKAIELLESLKSEPVINQSGVTKGASDASDEPYDFSRLNSVIREKCTPLFKGGNLSESVEKGFKVVRDRLRTLTGYEKGSDAFGTGKLHVKGAAADYVDEDFNQGVKFLTMAIDRFRNEKSHTVDGNIDNPQRAYEYLVLSSLAMNLLDRVEILS